VEHWGGGRFSLMRGMVGVGVGVGVGVDVFIFGLRKNCFVCGWRNEVKHICGALFSFQKK